MVLSNAFTSPRGNLSLQTSLGLAQMYLKCAQESTDNEAISVLCHDTKDALSQAKKVARKTKDESMNSVIAIIHNDLADLLDNQGHRDEAAAFRKKSEKWG
jgi:hypothetical protein